MTAIMDTATVTHGGSQVVQVGPYQLTSDGDTGWFVLYIEDNEDLDSWDRMVSDVAGMEHATIVSEAVLELDGQVRFVAEHWSQPSVLNRTRLDG